MLWYVALRMLCYTEYISCDTYCAKHKVVRSSSPGTRSVSVVMLYTTTMLVLVVISLDPVMEISVSHVLT